MDHSECRQVEGGINAHTHEGERGWWAFPDERAGILELAGPQPGREGDRGDTGEGGR